MGKIEFRTGDQIQIVENCFRTLNLLGHAQIEEIRTGSECGGHGRCGKDIIRLSGVHAQSINEPTEIEHRFFSQSELNEGYRLACQAFPNSDDLDLQVEVILP